MNDQMVKDIGSLPFRRFPLTPKGFDDAWNLISTDSNPNIVEIVAENLKDADGIRMLAKRLFRMSPMQMDALMDTKDGQLLKYCKEVADKLATDSNPRLLRLYYKEELEKSSPLHVTCRIGIW